MKAFGITRVSDITDYHIEEFNNLGYTILENVLTGLETGNLRDELMRIYAQQENEFGKENLKKISEENLARALLCYSEAFIELAMKEKVMEYVKTFLGNYFILHLQNGIINMPSEPHHQNSWHRDFPYQNWVSSEPIGCNVLYCLDDFNEETGATFLLPYSHKIPHMPSEEYLKRHAVQVNAKAGSAVLFDSMMFHKAGYNSSKTQIRRAVNHLYARAIVRQQIDIPEMLKGKYSDNSFLSMLLGYGASTPKSVNEWRSKKLNK